MKQIALILALISMPVAACGDKDEPKDTRKVVPIVGKYELTIAPCNKSGTNCSNFGYCAGGGTVEPVKINTTGSPVEVAFDGFGGLQLDVLSQTRIGSPEDHVPNPGLKNTSPDYGVQCISYFERVNPYVGDWAGRGECGGYTMDGTLVCTSTNEWSLHRTGDL